MDWKKLFAFLTGVAKIISFISLALSLYMKITALIGTTKQKKDEDEDDGGNDSKEDDSEPKDSEPEDPEPEEKPDEN